MSKSKRLPKNPSNSGIQASTIHAHAIAVGNKAKVIINSEGTGDENDEITKVFYLLLEKVDELPSSREKIIAENSIKGLEAEALRGDEAREDNINKWLTFLAETAPDIWDIVIATFINPIKGVSLVFQKIAMRAEASRTAKKKVANSSFAKTGE